MSADDEDILPEEQHWYAAALTRMKELTRRKWFMWDFNDSIQKKQDRQHTQPSLRCYHPLSLLTAQQVQGLWALRMSIP
jgi:hypothetical protein